MANIGPVAPAASLRDRVLTAVNAGRTPRLTGSGRAVLVTGAGPRGSYVVLVGADGAATPAGVIYAEITGGGAEAADAGGGRRLDYAQEPARRGDSEYARDARGQLVRLRTLGPDGSFSYTAAGSVFYSRRQVEYVVSVPVIIEGVRRNGRVYTRKDYLPIDHMGLGRIFTNARLTPAERIAKVKSTVLTQLGIRTAGGKTILLEVSSEVYSYDRDGEWFISELVTTPSEHGPQVQAILRRPMGALRACAAFLPMADQIVDEAFAEVDDRMCVPRQMAVLLRTTATAIADEFDDLMGGDDWREEGLTPLDVRAFCEAKGLAMYCVAPGQGVIESYAPAEPKGRAIAFCCYDGHAYFYKSARTVSGWRSTPAPAATEGDEEVLRWRLAGDPKCLTPPFSEWKAWTGVPEPGYWFCDDLVAERRALLNAGKSPKITIRALGVMSSLTVRCVQAVDGAVGECVLRQRPEEHEAIQAWLRRLDAGIEWRGERLPSITQRILLALLKAQRATPREEAKRSILARQRGACAECGEALTEIEWDHVEPLRQLPAGSEQKFQALCPACHGEKSQREGGSFGLESRFSRRAWKEYVESPRPPPLVWQPHETKDAGGAVEIDVRRCRQNALRHSAHDFPVFCPLDSIAQAREGVLGDFSYVVLSDRRKSRLSSLPFVGDGWYHRVAVEFGLHHAIIRWVDVLWSFSATGRIPRDAFEAPLAKMEAAWGEDPDGYAKMSVNMCVGLWATDTTTLLSVKSAVSAVDGAGAWVRRHFEYAEGRAVIDSIFQTKLLTNASFRPLHDMIMHTEATRVAQMRFIIESLGIPTKCIVDVKTDAVNLAGFARKVRRKLEDEVEAITFADLPELRRRYGGLGRGQSFLDGAGGMAGRRGDAAPVFRFSTTPKRLQGVYAEPARTTPPPGPLEPWRDMADAEAAAHVLEGGSLCVLGAPGTGKTYWVRELVKQLRAAGRRVDVISKTHSACKNFGEGCVTADHWVRKTIRNGRCAAQTVVVEEMTQISAYLWADIGKALFAGVTFVLVGDHAQMGAVKDTWVGCPVTAGLERSDLMRELCRSNRVTLTENRRSDPALFEFYTSLRVGTDGERGLAAALHEARLIFPVTDEPAKYTLCISHANRRAVNAAANLREKPESAVLITAPVRSETQQDMWLWPGLEVIGAGGKALKGLLYTVATVDAESVQLEGGLSLTAEQAGKCLRLSYALTYASVQGLTLTGRVRLSDTDSPHFSLRMLYVGSSRATAARLLEVADIRGA